MAKVSPLAKLTAAQVKYIRKQIKAGASQSEMARMFGVSQPTISQIVRWLYRLPMQRSLDYCYGHVDQAADRIANSSRPLHQAFAAHLRLVSKALKAVEWVYSCDNSPGSEDVAVRAVVSRTEELVFAREAIEQAIRQANEILVTIDE